MQIKKRADELAPGDVVVEPDGHIVMLRQNGPDLVNDGIAFGRLAGTGPITQQVVMRYFQPAAELNVETPNRTTPEEFAMLVEAADQLVKLHDSGDAGPALLHPVQRAALGQLVERLVPAVPPTLEEALALLADWQDAHIRPMPPDGRSTRERGADLLDRARRAGVLK